MKSKVYTSAGLIIAIIIVLNLLANEYHVRLDLTADNQYTLSDATVSLLEELEEPVTVKAYFSEALPPNVAKTRTDFQDLLVEYANLADGQLVYDFIDPNASETVEQEATGAGVRPVLINVREKDQVKQQKAFMGATVHLGDKQEIIPFVQPGAAMEHALSSAIKKLSIENKPKVGFLTGHGEPSLMEMVEANQQLQVLYETTEIQLSDTTDIPADMKTIAIIRPTDSIPANVLQKLDAFMARGGSLLVALNRVQADFRSMYGMPLSTGLEGWLREKGVQVEDNFVIDAQCGSVSVPQQFGAFTIQASVSFPYVPVVSTFAEHPVTSGLESVMFEFASQVKPVGDSTKVFTPLALTSEKSASLAAPQFFDIDKEWTEADFPEANLPIAAALEGTFGGEVSARMVVIGDGDFPINGPPQQQKRLSPDNINFLSNAVDWLSDDTGLIELRTKGAISRPIREVDDATKLILKYVNFLLPVVLAVAYGIFRAQRNRLRRTRLMNEVY